MTLSTVWTWVKRFALFVVCLIALIFFIAYVSMPRLPSADDYLKTAKQYDVEIIRDNLGIPHVYGKTDADTAFGLGYAQSEDDFKNVQTILLVSKERLATQLGASAAPTDFLVQFMAVNDVVNRRYEADVPQAIKEIAQAYADGVNLYAVTHPDEVNPYLFPVTGKDIIAGFTFKTPVFYGFDEVVGQIANPEQEPELALVGEDTLTFQNPQFMPIGSQGIAVAPSRSADGLTRLLVNSHQPMTGPVAWYEVRLHSEDGWNMAGSTFPGAPVVIHGHNESLGWSNTVNKPDLVDIYKLQLNPNNPNQYRLDGEWREFEIKKARMIVKLFGPLRIPVTREFKVSDHGPVMENEFGAYAIRWAGMDEVRTLEFLVKINKAKNQETFEEALSMTAMPNINYVYADKDGNVAHYYNAMFPNRTFESIDWSKVLPGDRSDLIWQGYRDYSAMPKTLSPESGLVYNANNPPFDATDGDDDPTKDQFPLSMGIESIVTNRALQIEALFAPIEKITDEDFKRVKFDKGYHPSSFQLTKLNEWLALDLNDELNATERAAKQLLLDWDAHVTKTSTTAALAVFTMAPIQKNMGGEVDMNDVTQAFKDTVSQLIEHHDSVRVPYGNVVRLMHGSNNQFSEPLAGGPDTLRAIYTDPMNDNGEAKATAGDGFMMVVAWDENGLVSTEAAHQFGSATQLEDSPHYADQMKSFSREQWRDVLFEKDALLAEVTARYHPRDRSEKTN